LAFARFCIAGRFWAVIVLFASRSLWFLFLLNIALHLVDYIGHVVVERGTGDLDGSYDKFPLVTLTGNDVLGRRLNSGAASVGFDRRLRHWFALGPNLVDV
jgi:hypothetical protein